MSRSAAARAATSPELTTGTRPRVASGDGRPPMRLVKGGARPRTERAQLSLEAKVLVASVAGLCLLGLPIVLSASAPSAIMAGTSPWSFEIRQCLYMAIGVLAAVIVSRTPALFIRKLRFVLPFVALSLLVVVFVPGIGQFSGGFTRWVGVGPIQIQPSELAKLAMVVFAADLLARRAKRADQWAAVVRPLLGFMAVAAVLIIKQPDLGTAIVLGCITFSMLFAAGVRLWTLVLPGGTVMALGLDPGPVGDVPSRPPLVVPQPVRTCLHDRLPGGAVTGDSRPRRGDRERGRRIGHGLGVLAEHAHRLRLCRNRRQSRSCRGPRRDRRVRSIRLGRL